MDKQRTTDQARRLAQGARRAAHRDLIGTGLSETVAEAWCAAWEAEAARHGLPSNGRYFWNAGRGWIDAQRSFPGRGRLERVG
jgi:hypothetical protein